MLRKRSMIKVLIAVPIVWLVAMIMFGINNTPTTLNRSNNRDLERIKHLEAENNDLIARAAQRYEEERRHLQEQRENNQEGDDNDHPEEERKKAQEQQKQQAGPVQVHAPVDRNPNAPGLFLLFSYLTRFLSLVNAIKSFLFLGELGRPVNIDKDKLSPSERIKFDEGWKNNAFNQYASDMISLHRSLADIRDPAYRI